MATCELYTVLILVGMGLASLMFLFAFTIHTD